ncbi:Uncharacterised protein [Raoultella planticola]|uniref:Uncharacterized protein n=1 Tax=Raoultella planticola TaxID=575 RepID=A0A8G2E4V4_RAOPL|nr:hypothetical protein [Raoultella planticola]MCQ6501162.1 hypothetical protein [Raoultella planticola]MDU3157703.1 hypothetical protein [Hafnia alvei]SAQ02290.1 Uncharacterised protein [Raoultella planticola]
MFTLKAAQPLLIALLVVVQIDILTGFHLLHAISSFFVEGLSRK